MSDPERFGVVEFDASGQVLSIEEKAAESKVQLCGDRLIFLRQPSCRDRQKNIKPSARGELEITDINRVYLEQKSLKVEMLRRGFAWLDTGTHDSLLEASHFVHTIEKRQGLKVACLEEIAYNNGWISAAELSAQAERLGKTGYGQYLERLLETHSR